MSVPFSLVSDGLTPTCVGRTPPRSSRRSSVTAHPHVRGEDLYTASGTGSEPWLTPTCVGRTPARCRRHRRWPAHPHVRGEDRACTGVVAPGSGSPPRAWGGPMDPASFARERRLTPTCVGRTAAPAKPHALSPAHPHVRGEDRVRSTNPGYCFGSPPRAWGGRRQDPCGGAARRLTPTCVGRTWCGQGTWRRRPAHPHVRGEDSRSTPAASAIRGSPPRAWGGHPPVRARRPAVRLTPTCVGRTTRVGSAGMGDPGSPPRAWGGRGSHLRGPGAWRLTPTCVGRTARHATTGVYP